MKDKNEDIINLSRYFYSYNSKERKFRGKENRRRTHREREIEIATRNLDAEVRLNEQGTRYWVLAVTLKIWLSETVAERKAMKTITQHVPWAERISGASFAQTCFFGRTRSNVVFLQMSAESQKQGSKRSYGRHLGSQKTCCSSGAGSCHTASTVPAKDRYPRLVFTEKQLTV